MTVKEEDYKLQNQRELESHANTLLDNRQFEIYYQNSKIHPVYQYICEQTELACI